MNPIDRNFDDIAQRFTRTIYDSPKGRLRLAALNQDFSDCAINVTDQQVLDIGGGQGQFALQLAQQGAQIHLCDISQEMLALAQHNFAKAQLSADIRQGTLQEVNQLWPQSFDVVLNHAVLEWLEQPLAALPLLAAKVKSGGHLSLMFYNLHGHIWRQLMNGGLDAPLGANPKLRSAGNAPHHPLDPAIIQNELEALGFTLLRWRGIRCIHDHMPQKIRERVGEDAYTQADLAYGLLEPYRQFGRYVHFLARKV